MGGTRLLVKGAIVIVESGAYSGCLGVVDEVLKQHKGLIIVETDIGRIVTSASNLLTPTVDEVVDMYNQPIKASTWLKLWREMDWQQSPREDR